MASSTTPESPLVSIITPTYNHVGFIKEALDSALAQDYPRVEIIVADDGSTDGTTEIVRDYAQKYADRIIALPWRSNQGIGGIVSNYNRALRACKGKYISFLEGDDIFLRGKLHLQVEWLEADPQRVLCGHDVEFFDSLTGKTLYSFADRFQLRSGSGPALVVENDVPFCTVSIMVRSGSLPENGLDSRLRIVCDWMLWIDVLASGGTFGYVPGVWARYRRHGNNITSHHFQTRQDDQFITLALVESRYPHLLKSCRRGRARLFYRMGIAALICADYLAARGHFQNSIAAGTNGQWKAWRGLLISLLPSRISRTILERSNMAFRAISRP